MWDTHSSSKDELVDKETDEDDTTDAVAVLEDGMPVGFTGDAIVFFSFFLLSLLRVLLLTTEEDVDASATKKSVTVFFRGLARRALMIAGKLLMLGKSAALLAKGAVKILPVVVKALVVVGIAALSNQKLVRKATEKEKEGDEAVVDEEKILVSLGIKVCFVIIQRF